MATNWNFANLRLIIKFAMMPSDPVGIPMPDLDKMIIIKMLLRVEATQGRGDSGQR